MGVGEVGWGQGIEGGRMRMAALYRYPAINQDIQVTGYYPLGLAGNFVYISCL